VDPIKAYFPISEQAYVLAQKQSSAVSSKHTISFFGNSLDLILTDGSIFLKKAKSCWPTDRWIQTRARSASSLPSRIPATFCVPANMDVCMSKPT